MNLRWKISGFFAPTDPRGELKSWHSINRRILDFLAFFDSVLRMQCTADRSTQGDGRRMKGGEEKEDKKRGKTRKGEGNGGLRRHRWSLARVAPYTTMTRRGRMRAATQKRKCGEMMDDKDAENGDDMRPKGI